MLSLIRSPARLSLTSILALLAIIPTTASAQKVVNITCVEFLGNITSDPPGVVRDLGFWGNIGGTGILTYGDTFICPSANPLGFCTPVSANSAATSNPHTPLIAHDFNLNPDDNHTSIFCDYLPSEAAAHPTWQYGMGLTNVVETDAERGRGVVFFLKNFRPMAVDQIQGSGVAEVAADGGKGFPTCERKEEIWWDARRPYWGDHSILKDPNSEYLYVYGGYPSSPSGPSDVYLARVPLASALDKSTYTYWNGHAFSDHEILDQTPSNRSAAVMLGVAQGSAWYSSVWGCYVYFSTSSIDPWVFVILTAPKPWGPWSGTDRMVDGNKVIPAQSIYDARENVANRGMQGQFAYSPAVQPQYDASGESVVITYTYASNVVQAVRLRLCDGCLPACDIVWGKCGLPVVKQPVDE